jgi:cation-transporting P-type ATPase I
VTPAAATVEAPRVLHVTPGRIRVALRGWDQLHPQRLEAGLRALPHVTAVRASTATGNALIHFDAAATDADAVLRAMHAVPRDADLPAEAPARPSVARVAAGRYGRARIAVRGLDRDPQLARRVVERLQARPDVARAVASQLTCRVLVEFSRHVDDLDDILSEITGLELPELPGEVPAAHPLDRGPLIQSGARLVGSALGLALLAVRRARGSPARPVRRRGPETVAALIGIADGMPPVRSAAFRAFGPDTARLALGGLSVLSLTLSGSPIGLAVAAASALPAFLEARARRKAWMDYEEREHHMPPPAPGAVVQVEAGERVPLRATVVRGEGVVTGRDALPHAAAAGAVLEAGAIVIWGALTVELLGGPAFVPAVRPAPPKPTLLERYLSFIPPISLAYAGAVGALTRSLGNAFSTLLLVNPRPAILGADAAGSTASMRVIRAGVVVVGTRPHRRVVAPDVLFADGPRVLTDGFERSHVVALDAAGTREVGELAAAVAGAAGEPWGRALAPTGRLLGTNGRFAGGTAVAEVDGSTFRLGAEGGDEPEVATQLRALGEEPLVLREAASGRALGVVSLRPQLAPDLEALRVTCARHGTEVILVDEGEGGRVGRGVAGRARLPLATAGPLAELVRERQREGARVAVLSDSADAAEAFDACDIAVAMTNGRRGRFPARADLLAGDLAGVAAVVEAGARRNEAEGAGVAMSLIANGVGAAWAVRGAPGLARASSATFAAALGAIAAAWLRLRGGRPAPALTTRLVDPRPERWGRLSPKAVLAELGSGDDGLSADEARRRRRVPRHVEHRHPFVSAMAEQLRSPLTGVLVGGAGLSLAVGALADTAMISAVIVANALVGAWQERQAVRATEALDRMRSRRARVLREGEVLTVDATAVVPGDILLLAPGDGVVADARLIDAESLEVDEAPLTGESMPVSKAADAPAYAERMVLEGSAVTVGTARAVVVAIGADTRLGATAAALAVGDPPETPLGRRLARLVRQTAPIIVGGGLLATLAGIAWNGPSLAQLSIGASLAIAAVPEGLPLLAGVAETAAARRLAARQALVRRMAAVEALGRVDVACCDKTGTLTQGTLAVARVATLDAEAAFPGQLTPEQQEVLLAAAIASPHPDAPGVTSHPTDVAILEAAARAGLDGVLRRPRDAELPFDPARGFHAVRVGGRTCVKGAPEVVAQRCSTARRGGEVAPLDDAGRAALLEAADRLAAEGVRVLLAAEGGPDVGVEDPRGLTALGFVGIRDPLREGVPDAVRRCHAAGVRVVMLTGDHPATARAIARDAGLPIDHGRIVTGDDIAALDDAELEQALDGASVLARITPLDKLRIVEALRRRGHTVAMTGDGVNDAPALRLADVGVAMGRGGTEVARQAADVVLADDDFATLAEALVEGRGFWRNLRGALGLLLGGNLGELGLVVGAIALGRGTSLNPRQILAVNLVTDVLPAMALAVQPPEQRDLSQLAREGERGLDAPLRREILRRGAATAGPSLAAYLVSGRARAPAQTVAYSSVVATQLAQTLDAGRHGARASRPVALAALASSGVLAASVTVPAIRAFLGLAPLTPAGLALVLAAAAASVLIARGAPADLRLSRARAGRAEPDRCWS